jgi:hypothetical protein
MAEGTTAAAGSPAPYGFSFGRSISAMSTSGEGDLLLERTAHRVQHVPLDLVLDAVRVDDLSAIMHDREMLDAELSTLTVHLDRGDSADIGAIELVLHKGDATAHRDVAALALRRRTAFPLGEACQPLQEFDTTRIVEVPQPELERVGAGCGGELIHEGLIGEGVLQASRGANPAWTERRLGQPVRDGPHGGEGVGYG